MKRRSVRIYEVAPRDGLQNEPEVLDLDDKLALIEALARTGLTDLEVTSFVRPSWVPQLADSDHLVARLPRVPGLRYWALVPNMRGLERAIEAGVGAISTVVSASDTHNRKNLNRTRAETLAAQAEVIRLARDEGLAVRSYVSTALGCPYEGEVPVSTVVDVALRLRDFGAGEIALGDTTGMGHPRSVRALVAALVDAGIPLERLALHLHDTRGTALANALAGFEAGVRSFDGAVAGVGGCPYAEGAAGNLASEDLVYMFEAMGEPTGVDLDRLAAAGHLLEDLLGRPLPGRYHRWAAASTCEAGESCIA